MPLITKPNYNQIFASQAPDIDKPPLFNNPELGWAESRQNNGKPTIKQFNYLLQMLDLKSLWILQNGACLPYDATIEYASGSLSLKDGIIQQYNGTTWTAYRNETPYTLKYFTPGTSYPANAEITLTDGDKVKNVSGGPLINDPNTDMTGWVKVNAASQIFDESGKTQQEINNNLIRRTSTFMPENLSDVSIEFQAYANSLNDGDTLIIPSGDYNWLNQAVVTKQINIVCNGVFKPQYRSNSAHLVFRSNPDYTHTLSSFVTSFNKGLIKLPLVSAFSGNLSEYYAVIESPEIIMHRSGFDEDYLKNILIDFVGDDGLLRDTLPFTINDLSTATIKLVKKRIPVTHQGLKFDIQGTGGTTTAGQCVQYIYTSNIKTVSSYVNQGKNALTGSAFSLSYCYGLHFDNCDSTVDWLGSNLTYNFLYWVSSYCKYTNCGSISKGSSTELQKGIAGRHGYKMQVLSCDIIGVDDHWGYDLTVKDSYIVRGVSLAGGSCTIDNCSGDVLFRQRTDPPYNDGTLTITNSSYSSNLLRMLGYDDTVWVSKDYATRKCFDVINISNISIIASTLPTTRSTTNPKMILMRDPQLDETSVFRDTVMNISNISIINDVSGVDPVQLIDCFDENSATPYKNYDKKVLFSKISFNNVNVLFINGANKWRSGKPPVADMLSINNCTNLDFFSYRARLLSINNSDCGSVGIGSERLFDCQNIVFNNLGYNSYSGSYKYVALADRYYSTILLNIYNCGLPSQSFLHNGFTNYNATQAGCVLNVAEGNSYNNYDLLSYTGLDYVDLRSYNSTKIMKTTLGTDLTLAAGVESSVYTRDFPTVRVNSMIIGKFDTQPAAQVIIVNSDTVANGVGKVYFKVKNISTASITVPWNLTLNFAIV